MRVVPTPNAGTIASLVDLLNGSYPREDRPWAASDTLKNVLFMLTFPDGRRVPLAVGLPGDREVDLKRLEAAVEPAVAEPFAEADFAAHPQLIKGYIGPQVLGVGEVDQGEEAPAGAVRYLVDPAVVDGSAWVTGANEIDAHVIDLVCGRDFAVDGVLDVAEIRDGDPSPDGSGPLTLARGIEMGHIFQLGRKYADALGLKVLDPNGKLATVTMGSYGIGVSRAVAAIAENTCDDKGLSWPRNVAPFDVQIVVAGKGEEISAFALDLAERLDAEGVEVLLDDRNASPGVKFNDAELLGMPTTVVVGRGLADGVVEVRDRASGDKTPVAVGEVLDFLLGSVTASRGSGRPISR